MEEAPSPSALRLAYLIESGKWLLESLERRKCGEKLETIEWYIEEALETEDPKVRERILKELLEKVKAYKEK